MPFRQISVAVSDEIFIKIIKVMHIDGLVQARLNSCSPLN